MTDGHIDLTGDQESQSIEKHTEISGDESQSELEQLKLDLEQAKDRSLRALADLENYRARVNRQFAEERKYSNIDLMRDLLPVWDNVGRALEAAEKTHNIEALIDGVKLVEHQFLDVLRKYHCVPIEALHQSFDPNLHASIAQFPNEEYPANTVIVESQVGFKLHERVVRPSQVVLSQGQN